MLGLIQAPNCLVWVVLLLSRAVFLYCNHLSTCYAAALPSLCLIGGQSLLLFSTMLSLRDSCVLLRTGIRLWHQLLYLLIFLSCYIFVFLILLSFCLFCILSYIILIHSFVCVGPKCPFLYRCRVMLPFNSLVHCIGWVDWLCGEVLSNELIQDD